MSDENTEDKTEAAKGREPKKNSIPRAEIDKMITGIPQYEKTSFLVVGHKNGVRIAMPKTSGVARAYFYANGDYSLIPDDSAIIVFNEEQRKEQRRGGIMAEVNFDGGLDAAHHALKKLVDVVRKAQAPEPKIIKPKAPKKEKAVAPAKAAKLSEASNGLAMDDGASAADEATAD